MSKKSTLRSTVKIFAPKFARIDKWRIHYNLSITTILGAGFL